MTPDDTNEFYSYRKISKHSLNEFQTSLSHETQEDVFSNNDNDANIIFNNFLNTFLRNFYASFPKKIKNKNQAKFQCLENNWDKYLILKGTDTYYVGRVMILN